MVRPSDLSWDPGAAIVVEQGAKPGAWCLASTCLVIIASVARTTLSSRQERRGEGKSGFDVGLWFWTGLAIASAPLSGLLLRAVFAAAQDVSTSLIFAISIAEELSAMMLSRIFAFWVNRQAASAENAQAASRAQDRTRGKEVQNVRASEVQVPFTKQVGIAITLGTLDALGSFCKSLSFIGISVSTVLVIRNLAVPMALGLSALGFGKGRGPREGQPGPRCLRTLLLLAGTGCFTASALLSPKADSSHVTAQHALGFRFTTQTCIALMLCSVMLGVVEGQTKEFLLHRKSITATHLQTLASAGSIVMSAVLLFRGIYSEGRPTWLRRSTMLAMAYPWLMQAMCKAFDQVGEVMIIEKASYTFKKSLSLLRAVPATMFEIIAFYIFGNATIGRPWGLNSWFMLSGLVAILWGITL